MIKYCTESELDLGFILDFVYDNDIITAKVLLILPFTEACIDIISSPLPHDKRFISIPDWSFSFTWDIINFNPYDFVLTLCNNYAVPYKEILAVTIDIMHSSFVLDCSTHHVNSLINDNHITTAKSSFCFSIENQNLPF